jgi:glycosyltransferase involved in cell wall biosynthesis
MAIKIAYIAKEEVENLEYWSGIPYNIYYFFKKKKLSVTLIDKFPKLPLKIFKLFELFWKCFRVKYDPNRSIFLSKYYSRLIEKKIFNSDYDYIFTYDSTLISFLETKIPIILWTDLTFDLYQKTYFKKNHKINNQTLTNGNYLEKLALKKCKKIIYSSKYALENAHQKYKIDRHKLNLIPFPGDFHFQNKNNINNLIQKKLPNKSKILNFLSVGVDWHRKGMDKTIKFIEYIQKINKKHTIKLNIVGCKNNSVIQNKNIKIHGYLSKNNPNDIKKLNQLYSKANFFILLSRQEALGIVFLEAASYALPIITNKVGGIRTIVKKNGIFFNLNDNLYTQYKKFKKLLKNKNYIKYSKSSLKQYENNNPKKIFDKFTRIIC